MSSTSAYVVSPREGGPGVLVLHSWWGLTSSLKALCDRLADEGFVALAPDLLGAVAHDDRHGRQLLAEADPNLLALGVQSSIGALRGMPATSGHAIGVLGFSMGASLGLWLSERKPALIQAVVACYGTQGIDFTQTQASYQLHMVVDDPVIDADELALMEASLHLAGRTVDLHQYEGVGHGFAEAGTERFDAAATEAMLERAITFLRAELAHRA